VDAVVKIDSITEQGGRDQNQQAEESEQNHRKHISAAVVVCRAHHVVEVAACLRLSTSQLGQPGSVSLAPLVVLSLAAGEVFIYTSSSNGSSVGKLS
jgi:hypothetical protein